MKTMSSWEKKTNKFAIPRLTLVLVVLHVFFFVAVRAEIIADWTILAFDFKKIFVEFEVWRLISFPFIKAAVAMEFISFLFFIYIFYLVGTAIENVWSTIKYNLFFFIPWLLAIIISSIFYQNVSLSFSDTFMYIPTFLAFCHLFPNFTFLLFFILPIQAKWLGFFTWALVIYFLISSKGVMDVLLTLSGVAGLLIFLGKSYYYRLRYKQRKAVVSVKNNIEPIKKSFRHQCIACGKTDVSNENLDFRYIEESGVTKCYCVEHYPQAKI